MPQRLRLADAKASAQQVVEAGRTEGHMTTAEDAYRSVCLVCQKPIATTPFYKVDGKLAHEGCVHDLNRCVPLKTVS